jgi:hypothetical protein
MGVSRSVKKELHMVALIDKNARYLGKDTMCDGADEWQRHD